MKIKAGDNVVVVAGKDKGKTGVVLRALPSEDRVVVGGVNMVTKHVKKTQEKAGERIEKEASLHVSNVMVVDGSGNASRVRYEKDSKGGKTRHFVTTGDTVTENFTKG